MTASSKIVELTGIARGLGFEVTCHQDVSSVDPGTPLGARLQGNGVHFGGTVGECAAFLAGWGTLRARLLGELCAAERSKDVSDPLREAQPPAVTQLSAPGIGVQEMTLGSGGAPRGAEFLARSSAHGETAALSRRSSRRSTVGDPGAISVERLPSRDRRQAMIAAWAELAFGREEATGLPQRGLRLLEGAIEVFQACGAPAELAHELVSHVFKRPCGLIGQGLGGVAVSLLALASAAGRSADAEECLEIHRVLSRPVEEFSRRNAAKNAAGFKMSEAPVPEVVL